MQRPPRIVIGTLGFIALIVVFAWCPAQPPWWVLVLQGLTLSIMALLAFTVPE